MSPSAALLAPLRTVRRSRLEDRNQSEPPTNTPFASPREAQSSGAQCEGGWADARGFTIAFDIVGLLQSHDLPRHVESLPKEPARQAAFGAHRRDAMALSRLIDEARQVGYCVAEAPRR